MPLLLQIHLVCKQRIVADYCEVTGVVQLCGEISRLLHKHEIDSNDLQRVCILKCKRRSLMCSSARVSNICGKVTHWQAVPSFRREIAPYVQRVQNEFGCFNAIYHVDCNVMASSTNRATLFRGGCDSQKISEVLDVVLNPESIYAKHCHMIVASMCMGFPINLKTMESLTSERYQGSASLFEFSRDVKLVETYFETLRFRAFSETFCRQHIPNAPSQPSQLIVNVSRTGTSNMFLSLNSEPEFYVGIEHDYWGLFAYIFDDMIQKIRQ